MNQLYGYMAQYAEPEAVKAVLKALRAGGFTRFQIYAPFPHEELIELLPGKTRIHWVMLAAALLGCAGAYFLQWYAVWDYPLNVGGRPIHSWPSFVPVTFELTVLTTALIGVCTLFWFTRLPRLDHPTFNDPRFIRASQDRFFICVRADDPHATRDDVLALLANGAESVREVLI